MYLRQKKDMIKQNMLISRMTYGKKEPKKEAH
jgi:hypothetical protein